MNAVLRIDRLVQDLEAEVKTRAAAPSRDPETMGMLRRSVREVLGAAKTGRRFTAKMLLPEVAELMAREFALEDLAAALKWNREQGYVNIRFNEDFEREEYALTPLGIAKDAADE